MKNGEYRSATCTVDSGFEMRNKLHVKMSVAVVGQKAVGAGPAAEKVDERIVSALIRQPDCRIAGFSEGVDNAAYAEN